MAQAAAPLATEPAADAAIAELAEVEVDDEDSAAAIEERVRAVEQAVSLDTRRKRCYAAAMSRALDVLAHVFMPQGPREWPLQGGNMCTEVRRTTGV